MEELQTVTRLVAVAQMEELGQLDQMEFKLIQNLALVVVVVE